MMCFPTHATKPPCKYLQALSLLLCLVLAGCTSSKTPAPVPTPTSLHRAAWFQDITREAGVDFVQRPGPANTYFMPDSMGSGAGVFDFDNDGRLDIYLLQGGDTKSGRTNRLYHQEPNGRFRDVSAGSGLDIAGYGMGVAAGDFDNDGRVDVLVCGFTGVRLLRNLGGGKFRDLSREAGVSNAHWAVSAAFFDYDRDGWLDLVIVNYVNYLDKSCPDPSGQRDYCGPADFTGSSSRLFHNQKNGRFKDVTVKAGLGQVSGAGLGVSTLDFDGDSWPDILITQDAQPNRLWINNHDGTFQDKAQVNGIAVNAAGVAQANMGIAVADLGDRGAPSVYVTHLGEEGNTLWTPTAPGLFEDRTAPTGLAAAARATGFGTVLSDFDNDGFPDLAIVNGRVRRSYGQTKKTLAALGPHWSQYAETNQLLANTGAGKFRDICAANPSFCDVPNVGRGLVAGDLFNDGGIALLTTSINGPARLYRNIAPRAHWLGVRAIEPKLGGRDAYGARVTIVAGERRQSAWIQPSYSMACSNDPRAHFGLGARARIESIEVLWPDGRGETFPAVSVNQIVTLRRGAGQPMKTPPAN